MTAVEYLEQEQKQQFDAGIVPPREEQERFWLARMEEAMAVGNNHLFERCEKVLRCPSKYQLLLDYFYLLEIFDNLVKGIEAGVLDFLIGSKLKRFERKEMPIFGTLHMQRFSAYITPHGNINDPVIILSDGLLAFSEKISNVIAISFPFEKTDNGKIMISSDIEKIKAHIKENKNGLAHFIDILTAEMLFGTSILVEPLNGPLLSGEQQGVMAMVLRDAFQSFIVAHEYSHYIDGHLGMPYLDHDDMAERDLSKWGEMIKRNGGIRENYRKELFADCFGLIIAINSMTHAGYPRALSFARIYLCLNSIELVEKIINLRYRRKENHYQNITHPPPMERKKVVLSMIEEDNETETLNQKYFDAIDYIFESYWDEFREFVNNVYTLVENDPKIDSESSEYKELRIKIYETYGKRERN